MLPAIVGLSFEDASRTWKVRVRFSDGTFGHTELGENSLVDAGTHLLGQVMLWCWLTGATPDP